MRRTPTIVVFFVFFSAAATLLEVSGTTAAMGVSSPTGTVEALDTAQQAMSEISASSGVSDTLFGSFVALASSMEALGRGVFAGPLILSAAGVPGPIVAFLFAPAGIIVGLDIYHAVTGRFA